MLGWATEQNGDAKAIEVMKKCLEREPKREFFKKQLRRFEMGDPKLPIPTE
jgi:hypothetical protein